MPEYLYKSLDGGNTWNKISDFTPTTINAIAGSKTGNTIYVATGNGLWKSDSQQKFVQLSKDLPSFVESVASSQDGKTVAVSAGHDSKSSSRSLYVSHDAGNSWKLENIND